MAPLLANPGQPTAPLDTVPEMPLAIKPMCIDRTSLYLCAVGEQHRSKEGLNLAAGGVQRILTTH